EPLDEVAERLVDVLRLRAVLSAEHGGQRRLAQAARLGMAIEQTPVHREERFLPRPGNDPQRVADPGSRLALEREDTVKALRGPVDLAGGDPGEGWKRIRAPEDGIRIDGKVARHTWI